MKATLVIDKPKNCDRCQFNYDMGFGCDALDDDLAYGGDKKEMQGEIRPSWCPLDSKKNRAIPIEWIDGYIKRRVNDAEIYAEILFISDMVTEWEKENARD